MKIAIISDIHGNWEALQAVLNDIRTRGIDTIYCLGDIVGYGPDPELCLEAVRKNCSIIIKGNHEEALLRSPVGFHTIAKNAIQWTKARILNPWRHPFRYLRYWTFLKSLPEKAEGENCFLVHGSPRNPTEEYLLDRLLLLAEEEALAELFDFPSSVCFCGHTHVPCVFSETRLLSPAGADGQTVPLEDQKLIINVGSVGQPRDRDPRACYVEYSAGSVTFHRVNYDIEATRAKIRSRGLDDSLAERLAFGL